MVLNVSCLLCELGDFLFVSFALETMRDAERFVHIKKFSKKKCPEAVPWAETVSGQNILVLVV